MAGSPAPPPPPPSNSGSSAPTFKSSALGPSLGHKPAPGAFASQAAAAVAAQRPPVHVPSDRLVAVLGVVRELRARGLLDKMEEIPEAELTDEGASDLFDAVLAACLAEAWDPKAASCLTIPPPPLEGGRKVELLRLFLVVRARGGFAAVASWAAVAEAVGLDPAADMAVKLMYREYLELLDQAFDKPIVDHKVVESCDHADQRSGSTKDRFLSPTKDPTSAGSSAHLKRKRDPLVGMLNWVGRVARSPSKSGMASDPHGHFDTAVWFRDNAYCLGGERLDGMLNWVLRVAKSPAEPGVMGEDSCVHLSTAALLRRRQMLAEGPASPQSGHSNEGELRSTDKIFVAPIRPCGQADVPEWTGKPSSRSEDRRELRFLGEPVVLPESNEALDRGSIGKGRQDDCSCQFLGSIDCIRLHVAQKKGELKIGLGSAFYKMGLHQTGEDAALTWTKADERRFNTVIQDNLPTSKYNFWGKLSAAFRSKGSKGLVSYYHNVFQVQRRAYQNHLALDADSDDDNIEPGFLYSRQGDGESSFRSAAASRKRGRS